jgi:hypothetical protein
MEFISTVEKAISHSREFGKFIVVSKTNVNLFVTLVSAFLFYYHLDKEASLWDVTGDTAELLEQKYLLLSGSKAN